MENNIKQLGKPA